MLNELITIFALSAIPAAFGLFLDYALGFPGKEDGPNTKAILFRAWSLRLAVRALIINGQYHEVIERLKNFNLDQHSIDSTLFIEGKKLFFYEQAFGMCIYCTNFWISQLAALIMFFFIPLQFFNGFFFFLLIPIFSHSIIRKF